MIKKILTISFLIASVVIILNGCSKDDDPAGNVTNGKTTAFFNSNVNYGVMTDQDGNTYKTVTIGTQIWLAENLRTTKYNDGTAIPMIEVASEWSVIMNGACCNYNNTSNPDTIATYGRLYNFQAVNSGKLAPIGWHVATDADWTTLSSFLGSEGLAGSRLKEAGTTHWTASLNTISTNEAGFTALPGGMRNNNGTFNGLGQTGNFWSSDETSSFGAWLRSLNFDYSSLYRSGNDKLSGLSVRCVMD